MKICLTKEPPYADLGDGHISACWLHFMGKDGEKKEAAPKKKAAPRKKKQEVSE